MASASASLHEDEGKLNPKTIDQHRAFVSLQEELEAADWYNQRVEAATDPALAAILVPSTATVPTRTIPASY